MGKLRERQKIRVLIVDGSAVVRNSLSQILERDDAIEVVGTALDPFIARDKLVKLKPDVMILDIDTPKMDGTTFLSKVMQYFPTRTLIFSRTLNSTTDSSSADSMMRARELGAVGVIEKPSLENDLHASLEAMEGELIASVKSAANSKLRGLSRIQNRDLGEKSPDESKVPEEFEKAERSRPLSSQSQRIMDPILAIASSTGGTEALKKVLPFLPVDLPGTVIVQHMPPAFTKAYAQQLQLICPFEVKEAENGDRVLPGRVLIAPGNYHMEIRRSGSQYHIKLHQEPYLHGVRPSADYLMKSVAKYAGNRAIGVVLTGMGKDGAEGLLAMKRQGSYNIAQDENTCVVYGMPKVAVEMGAIHQILPLDGIAGAVISQVKKKR